MAAKAKPADQQEVPPSPGDILNYKTWVLKVLIHCDGCTKRIKKILQGIEGVYKTEIDSRQHKVTVTGNVEAETLIKKLSRSGKSVELWPEKPTEKKDKKSAKSKGHETENIINNKEKQDQKNSTEPVDEGCIDDVGNGEEDSDNEGNGDNKCEGGDNKCEGGAKKKKKKKKKNKSGSAPTNNGVGKEINSTETIDSVAVLEKVATTPKEIIMPPVPPVQQHAYNPYPPHMYYPHPPPTQAYGLSYNTSYPVSSTSYYVGAPVMPMPMHAYSRLPPPPPPSHPINNYNYAHNDHDEYEGGYCSIM